jgi:hypothetical protein
MAAGPMLLHDAARRAKTAGSDRSLQGISMTTFFFSGLREAFGRLTLHEQLSAPVRDVVNELAATPTADSLGFDGDDKPVRTRRVRERHPELDEKQLQLANQALDQIERRNEARRRFWVQLVVSLLVLGGAGGLLVLSQPNADMQKALFGLIGTVVGYWLR